MTLLAGCLRAESFPELGPELLTNAESGVVFVARRGSTTVPLPLSRARLEGLPAISVPVEAQSELWLYQCPIEALGPPTSPLPPIEGAEGGCADEGAPCPIRALSLSESGWRAIPARVQPWAERRDTGGCAVPSAVDADPLAPPNPKHNLRFVAPLGPGRVLVSLTLGEGPLATGYLEVRPVPIGPPLAVHTSTTIWVAATPKSDGRLLMLGHDRTTAIAWWDGALHQVVDRRLPAEVMVSCRDITGRNVSSDRGVGLASGGGEIWAAARCGHVLRRDEDGPWEVVHRAPAGAVVAGTDLAVYWMARGEVYATNALGSGALHFRDGRASLEPDDGLGGPLTNFVRTRSGQLYAGTQFGQLLKRLGERWTVLPDARLLSGGVFALIPVGDGFAVGFGSPGVVQVQGERSCADELMPTVPAGFVRSMLIHDGLAVAGFVGPISSVASWRYDYLPCGP